MTRGGCPVPTDDLEPRQWFILGLIREERDSLRLGGAIREALAGLLGGARG